MERTAALAGLVWLLICWHLRQASVHPSFIQHCCIAVLYTALRREGWLCFPKGLIAFPNRLRGRQQVHTRLHLDNFLDAANDTPKEIRTPPSPGAQSLNTEAYFKFPYLLTAS